MNRRLLFVIVPFLLTFMALLVVLRPQPAVARPEVAQVVGGVGDAAALIPLNNNIYNAGRLTIYNQAVFGPQCRTYYGDAFSPFSSTFRPPGYYTNPNYGSQHFSYRYRIDIPPDYELHANSTIVRVELFDPETHNSVPISTNNYTFTHSAPYVAQGNPSTGTGICEVIDFPNTQMQPCIISTHEDSSQNPFWFVRIDENRIENSGNCLMNPSYNPAYNTETAYDLYYYQQSSPTVTAQPIATYVGRKDNDHDTDLRWISPGAAQSYDQPVFVPVTAGPGSFEVDLETIGDIAADPETGMRSLYLDVTTLSGASENGFDIWAGPPSYTGPTNPTNPCLGGVPSEVNARNLHIINCDYHSHDSAGVTIYALDYWPTNYNTGTAVEKRVIYVGPEYAGHSLYIHLFDSDAASRSPIVFYFDTLAYQVQDPIPVPPADPTDPAFTDWYWAFAVNNTLTDDPDLLPGQSRNCRPGTCNDLWITPPYRIDVPTMSPDCVDMQTTPQQCTPFHGGWLMVRYLPNRTDTMTWRVELPELPPENTVDSCPAFPITFKEDAVSISEADYDTVLSTQPNQMYPMTPAPYGSFYYHTPGHTLQHGPNEAQPGDVFLLEGEGWLSEYSFLQWRICASGNCSGHVLLQNSLTWPGNSLDPVYGFREAGNWDDTNLQLGDRVVFSQAEGVSVTDQLVGHVDRGRVLRLLIWNESGVLQGGGPGNSDVNYYKVAQFATFRILGFHVSGVISPERWLLVEFVGWDDLCGRPGPNVGFTENSYEVNEVGMGISLTVALSDVYSETVTVAYQTGDNTATAGQDYAAASGILTFTPGTFTQAIPLTILADLDVEGNETFSVTLSHSLNANIMGVNPVSVTILDDENPSLISFTVAALAVGEGEGMATVVVQQNGAYTGTVSVNYQTSAGTATAGPDYTTTNGTLVFAGGVLTQTITIPIGNDSVPEINETFYVLLLGAINGVVVGANPLPVTIVDNDIPGVIQFAAATATVSEGGSQVQVLVTQDGAQDTATVQYTTSNGTATAEQDYTLGSGTLIFPLGVTTQTITIPILEDTVLETSETFFITLSNPVNGVIQGPNPMTVTIMDNEAPAQISFVAAALTVPENGGPAVITLHHNATSAIPIQVNYATSNGTAANGQDYTASSGTVIFPAGLVTRTFTIPLLNDTLLEGDETFFVTLSAPVNGVIVGTNPLTVTITDDEEPAQISFAAASVTVSETVGIAELVVQHNGAHTSPIQVSYATSNGTAVGGFDYLPSSGVLTFTNSLTATILIPIINDPIIELNETFFLTLSNPVNGVIVGSNPMIITITGDEPEAQISFVTTALTVAEDSGAVELVVQQSGVHQSPVQVNIATSNGTASSGQDYTAITDTLIFGPGVLTQTITIPILNDTLLENDETFRVTLSDPVNGVIVGTNPAVITIEDNEQLAEIGFAAATLSVPETAGQVQVVIYQNGAHTSPLSVYVSTSNGTATAGQDYTPNGGTMNFNGAAAITITIPLNNDTLPEGHETFFVTLANPFNGTIVGSNPLQVIILDDECLFAPASAPGHIEAEDFACGGKGVAYHDSTPGNGGTSDYRFAEDVDVWDNAAASHTHYVGGTAAGEWLAYTVTVAQAGRYDLSIAAAALQPTQVRLTVDGVDVTGVLTLPATGGMTTFVEYAAAAGIQLSVGTHQIRFFIVTGGTNLDYLLLSLSTNPIIYLPFIIRP